MATLAQKIETEKRTREFLEDGGLPQPDFVEYGFTCIRLFFESSKTVLVVDIDEPPDGWPPDGGVEWEGGGEDEVEDEGEGEGNSEDGWSAM